ncbi:hypothetical protein ACFLUK_01035 [Chloroflexota bacterium]
MREQTTWELVNPEGTVHLEPFAVKPHSQSLENKTVLLHWNNKHNGDVFLSKIGELLTEKVEGVKIVKDWEVAPETATISRTPSASKEIARKLASFNPDLVIASQGD